MPLIDLTVAHGRALDGTGVRVGAPLAAGLKQIVQQTFQKRLPS